MLKKSVLFFRTKTTAKLFVAKLIAKLITKLTAKTTAKPKVKLRHGLILSLALSLTLSLSACSHKKVKIIKKAPKTSLVFLKNFNKAGQYLDKSQYKKASVILKELLKMPPPKKLKSLIWYNLAWSYESLGHYFLANKAYQQSLKHSQKAYKKLQSLSFVRLAYSYKFLSKADKELASLLEAYRAKNYLDDSVSQIQLPVRLGAVYWILKNKKMAKQFFLEAEKNILNIKIKYRDPKKKNAFLAKAFYLSGQLPRWSKKYKTIDRYIDEVFVLQIYLLRAVALGNLKWSKKAKRALIKSYKYLFKELKKQKSKNLKKNILYNVNKILASSKDLKASQNLKNFQKLKSKNLKSLIKQLKLFKRMVLSQTTR